MSLARPGCILVPVGADDQAVQRLAFVERRERNEVGRKHRLVAGILDDVRRVVVVRILDVERVAREVDGPCAYAVLAAEAQSRQRARLDVIPGLELELRGKVRGL